MESKPYDYFAAPSPLTKRLKAGHGGAKLSPDEWKTLILWMDFNVPEWNIGGGYSWNRPELREADPEGERRLRAAIREKLGDALRRALDQLETERQSGGGDQGAEGEK